MFLCVSFAQVLKIFLHIPKFWMHLWTSKTHTLIWKYFFNWFWRFLKKKWIKFFSWSTYNGCIISLITFMSFCLLFKRKHCMCLLINKRSKCQYARKKIITGKILSALVHTFFFFSIMLQYNNIASEDYTVYKILTGKIFYVIRIN